MSLSVSKKYKMVFGGCLGLSLCLLAAGFVVSGMSSYSMADYKSEMLLSENSPITHVVSSPSKDQVKEMGELDGVTQANSVYIIKRDVDFSKDTINVLAIDNLASDSLEGSLFQNVLSGDKNLGQNEIYFDQTLASSCGVGVGDTLTINFGTADKTFTVGGILSPISNILTVSQEGACVIRYDTSFDTSLATAPRIAIGAISATSSGAISSYLATYRPLGNIDSFETYDKNYRSMHSQGSYSDEEYAKIIQEAYDAYYSEAYDRLPVGVYQNKNAFFRDLDSSPVTEKKQETSKTELLVGNILCGISVLPLLVATFLNLGENRRLLKEGSSLKDIRKYRLICVDSAAAGSLLAGIIILLIIGGANSSRIATLGSLAFRIPYVGLIIAVAVYIVSRLLERALLVKGESDGGARHTENPKQIQEEKVQGGDPGTERKE